MSTLEIKVGRTYRGKRPGNAGGLVNDRTVIWQSAFDGTVQYDGPAVRDGARFPKVMREHEDRCDHALEDVDPKHQVWDCADAAIRAVHGITGGSS